VLLLKGIYHLATMNDAGDRLAGVDILVEGNSISRVEACRGFDRSAPRSARH